MEPITYIERTTGLDMARATLLGEQKKLDQRIEQLCKDLYQLEQNRAKYEEELRALYIKNMGIADALIGIQNQVESIKEVAEKYPAPEFLGKFELPPDASEKVKHREYDNGGDLPPGWTEVKRTDKNERSA